MQHVDLLRNVVQLAQLVELGEIVKPGPLLEGNPLGRLLASKSQVQPFEVHELRELTGEGGGGVCTDQAVSDTELEIEWHLLDIPGGGFSGLAYRLGGARHKW